MYRGPDHENLIVSLFKSVEFEEVEFECPKCGAQVLATIPNDIVSEVSCKVCGTTLTVDLDACEPDDRPN